MFLLRCAFFLSIVWASIAFGSGAMRDHLGFGTAVGPEMTGIAGLAMERATEWCAERPARCARDAARLDALVKTMVAEPAGGSDEVAAETETPQVPMPVPDPRRRTTRAVLTDAF